MSNLSVHTLLRRCFHAQRATIAPCIYKEGLSPGQPKILAYLTEHDGCLQKDLAASCDIEPATVSKVLSGMEEAGLIERRCSDHDKRAVTVRITEKGRRANEAMVSHFARFDEKQLAGFTPEEIGQLTEYLVRLYRNMTGKDV